MREPVCRIATEMTLAAPPNSLFPNIFPVNSYLAIFCGERAHLDRANPIKINILQWIDPKNVGRNLGQVYRLPSKYTRPATSKSGITNSVNSPCLTGERVSQHLCSGVS